MSFAQLFAQAFARAPRLLSNDGRILSRRRRARWWQQQIEETILGRGARLLANFFVLFLAHHVDGELHQIAHHRLDVAADIANLGELRRFDLDER